MAVDVDRRQSFVGGSNMARRIPIAPVPPAGAHLPPSFPCETGGFLLFTFFLFPLLSRKNDLAYIKFAPFEGGSGCFVKGDCTSSL